VTTAPRSLTTPALEAQTFAVRRTCRASHPHALADLANDAAGGHPAQRATITRTTGGTFHLFYQPTTVARFLRVTAVVAQNGSSYTAGHAATLDVSVTDGTTTVASSDASIPYGLKADVGHRPAAVGLFWTVSGANELTWWLDVDELVTAGLDASLLWRLRVVIACDATVAVELVQLEEAPRMLVDTAESWGQIPTDYQPRSLIQSGSSGLTRIGTTARVARVEGIRTYHALVVPESAPWTITSTSFAAWPGDTESAGVARKWFVRARAIRGTASECRARYVIRYRCLGMSGADKATVRLHTGGTGTPFALDLTDLTGSWVTSTEKTIYLPTSAEVQLYWEAKVTAGSCEIVARPVQDYPE
jgi:hypothetical protein